MVIQINKKFPVTELEGSLLSSQKNMPLELALSSYKYL
jgi:hypothetical protein